MRRFETLLALLAVIFASVAAIPIAPRLRLLCALLAVFCLMLVISTRLRAAINGPAKRTGGLDPGERAEAIRRARESRYDR